jgi:hypothetical protein
LYSYLDILFLTEFSSIVLLATNIMEKMIKIATFNQVGNSTPLYEENSTIVESNTTTAVKINIKISEVFLLRVKVTGITSHRFFPSLCEIEGTCTHTYTILSNKKHVHY